MPKPSQRATAVILTLAFLAGMLLFLTPAVTELASYRTDENEYVELSMNLRPPGIDPVPEAPVQATDAPTEEPPARQPLNLSTETETVEAEDTGASATGQPVTEAPGADIVPTTVPASSEEPGDTAAPAFSPTPTACPETPVTKAPEQAQTAEPVHATEKPTTVPVQEGTNLEACLEQNKDFVAWLTIPGTKIDYPVVRSDRTEYYLHHLFNGKESKLGCLFSLTSSDYRTPSRNIAIYGHHLSHSDAMFSTLMDYKSASYCNRHSRILLDSLYGERTYRIFAVFNMNVSDWDAATASFSSDEDFMRFVNRAMQLSMYETGVEVTAEDNILTLITCDRSYGGASGRLIVMAVEE